MVRNRQSSDSSTGSRSYDSYELHFPQTSVSLLKAAASSDPERRKEAQEELLKRYWKPVYAYLRCRHYSSADSADLVQAFFSQALLSDFFAKADPERGRFRNFLLTSVKNFVTDAGRRRRTKSEIPSNKLVSIEEMQEYGEELRAAEITPEEEQKAEEIFRHVWTQELVKTVLRRLETEWMSPGTELHYRLFSEHVVKPILEGARRPKLRELGDRHQLDLRKVANMIVTVKRAFRRFLAEEIQRFALNQSDYAAEFREIMKFLKRQPQ